MSYASDIIDNCDMDLPVFWTNFNWGINFRAFNQLDCSLRVSHDFSSYYSTVIWHKNRGEAIQILILWVRDFEYY